MSISAIKAAWSLLFPISMKIKTPLFPTPVYFSGARQGDDAPIEVEVAMQWNDTYTETIYSYVNNIATRHGGTHLTGFSTALTRVLNNYIKSHNLLKSDKISITGEDMREGLDGGDFCQSRQSAI